MPRYKLLVKPKGRTLAVYKKKGYPTGYDAVTRGSGEGGGTRFFSSLGEAQGYARQLSRSYHTKIVEAPIRRRRAKKTQPSFAWGSSSMKSNGGWGL